MKTHLREIQSHCRRLNRRHLLLAAGLALADLAITWALVAAWNGAVDSIQEKTAAVLLVLSIPVVIGLWIWGYRQNRDLFHLDLRRMARRIENSHTRLNDLLVTAADLEERGQATPNALEQHVLDSAAGQLREIDWKAASTHWLERTRTVAIIGLLAVLMVAAAATTVPVRKAGQFIKDWIAGSASGLVIKPFPGEVPIGTDVTLNMEITRWQQSARIHWRDARGAHAEPVVIDASGRGSFTFYALESPTAFMIETPSLKSAWQSVEGYQPARLDAVDIEIRPPAYTRLDAVRHDQLTDLKVPEGGEVAFNLRSEAAANIALKAGESLIQLAAAKEQRFGGSLEPEESGPYRFVLEDAAGREEKSPVHELVIIPDRAPTVEILEPTRDNVLAPDQEFLLHVYSADDYGLATAQVHLKLSNSAETVLGLPLSGTGEEAEVPDAPIRESEVRAGISLEQLGASDGEFLALHVEVTDNREPEANRTRSDLLFIEIRTPIPPEERDGMPMEQKEINLRELIDEQKRILRETYRLDMLPPSEQANRSPELVSALSALGVEINRILAEIRPDLESAGRGDLIELFDQSIEDNLQAIAELEASRPEASFAPQSSSLSALLKLENAFRQNTISKKPSEGSGQGQSQGESSEKPKDGEQPMEQDLDKLLQAKESLEEMIAGQNQLNSGFDQAARSDWDEEAAQADAAAQRELVEQSRDLENRLSEVRESGRVRSMLNSARGHMSEAALEASEEDASGSLRSGLRARESMRRAAAELDTMIAEASGQQLAAAAQAAAQLARQQAEAATASGNAAAGNPSSEELAAMEARQRELKDRYEEFLEAMEQQARESAELSPEASQSLMEAAGRARAQSTGSDMERAANALLYGQPGMAGPLQSSAAEQLASLSESLSGAREQLGNNPMARARALNRELMSALEELASYAREPEAAPENRLPQVREDWAKRMDELREISGDPRFGQLSGQLGRANPGSAPEELAEARMVLQQGARLLREFLFNEATVSGMQINREAAPPPDEYRRMVEEYFRRLANEPSKTP